MWPFEVVDVFLLAQDEGALAFLFDTFCSNKYIVFYYRGVRLL